MSTVFYLWLSFRGEFSLISFLGNNFRHWMMSSTQWTQAQMKYIVFALMKRLIFFCSIFEFLSHKHAKKFFTEEFDILRSHRHDYNKKYNPEIDPTEKLTLLVLRNEIKRKCADKHKTTIKTKSNSKDQKWFKQNRRRWALLFHYTYVHLIFVSMKLQKE